MQLKKLLREYQGILISTSILLVCIAGFVWGIIPLGKKVIDENHELTAVSSEVAGFKNKVSVLQTIDESQMRNDIQTLLSAIPADKSLATLLSTVDGLAAVTGVSVDTISLAKPGSLATASAKAVTTDEKNVGSNILPFTLSISGSLDQIQAFFTYAVLVRRMFSVQTFNVSLKNETIGTGSANMVSANVAMDAFYASIPSSIGSVSESITGLTSSDSDTIAKVSAMQLLAGSSSPLPQPAPGTSRPDPFSL